MSKTKKRFQKASSTSYFAKSRGGVGGGLAASLVAELQVADSDLDHA